MNLFKFINSIIFFLILTISVYSQTNSWLGLTPLISTRADVEKLLGKPKDSNSLYKYVIEEGRVSFSYQVKICEGGWNVPKDTLLFITFEPKDLKGKSFEELRLDKNIFYPITDDALWTMWRNPQEGIGYYFSNVVVELDSIEYFPKKADNNLRCNGFPPFTPEGEYYTRDVFRFYYPRYKNLIYDIYNRIDGMLNELNSDNEIVGYILVYFDNKLSLKAYRQRLSKIRNHVFKFRKINPVKIKIIEGGMREQSEIQFFVLFKNQIPPAPNPTLPSPQFMKKK